MRSRSQWRSARSARLSRRAAKSSCSSACTSPRWRSGRCTASSRGMAPSHGDAERGDGALDHGAMAVAADAVQDNAGNAAHADRSCAKPCTTAAADCAWPATSSTSRTGSRKRMASSAAAPSPIAAPASAVEQPHGGFDDQEIGARRRLMDEALEQRRVHGPAVEIEAWRARGGLMEGRVDIVGAAFGGAHATSPGGGRPQEERASPWSCRRRSAARR